MTKEDIIKHLETCTDPNCEYRMIAQAIRELDRAKEPDTSKGVLVVGDKTFSMDQIAAAKAYGLEFAKLHKDHVDVFYQKGAFKSKPFKSYLLMTFDEEFKAGIEDALRELKEFEKEASKKK